MSPRITMNTTPDGQLELWLNPEGRDLLVRELQALSATNDHFHLGAWDGAEVEVKSRPYRPTDTLVRAGKVMFRTDEWDRTYYSHVIDDIA